MHSLVHYALVAWPADDDEPPDQHYQALLLRAISIVLLNPWIDDDQTGRRCFSPLPCLLSHNKACHSYNGTASLNPPLTYKDDSALLELVEVQSQLLQLVLHSLQASACAPRLQS